MSWIPPVPTIRALDDVANERERQESLVGVKFRASCATTGPDAMSDHERLAVLAEEFGEVAREVVEKDRPAGDLRAELIQVAAVAVAWVEALDSEATS